MLVDSHSQAVMTFRITLFKIELKQMLNIVPFLIHVYIRIYSLVNGQGF